jgi:hypothetical protein
MKRCVAVAVTVIALAGCTGTQQSAAPAGTSIPVERLRKEPYSFSFNSGVDEPERLVVRDAAAWNALWTRVHARQSPVPALPSVDFKKEMIVFASLGTQPSGGYSVLIDGASEAGEGAINVTVRSITPGAKCGVTAALTEPVDMARLARRDGKVQFVERTEKSDCP